MIVTSKRKDKSVNISVIKMLKVDKKTDERELKASYKEVIKQYLPQT